MKREKEGTGLPDEMWVENRTAEKGEEPEGKR